MLDASTQGVFTMQSDNEKMLQEIVQNTELGKTRWTS